MKKSLPQNKTLARKVRRRAVDQALDFLASKRVLLQKYRDVEDFVFEADFEKDQRFSGIEHNFVVVRAALARTLWANHIYLGISVVDSLVFQSVVHKAAADPILDFLETVRGLGLHRPGLVLYPVHSLGLIAGGLLQWVGGQAIFTVRSFGLALTPQTNDFDRTLRFMREAGKSLGVSQAVPEDLLRHWRRSRPTEWLERNPLILARIRSFLGSYYENQPFLVARLRLATGLILVASALQPEALTRNEDAFLASSSRLNNFQTLDLHHYFVFYPRPRRRDELSGDCVPMNADRLGLAEIAELPMELDPRHWRRRSRELDRASSALDKLGSLYSSHALFTKEVDARGRTARKLFNALKFFKRSYRQSYDGSEAVVNLAIAMEVLLTDAYAPNVAERIKTSLTPVFKGLPRKERRRLLESVDKLYVSRNQVVHTGATNAAVDISASRRAFAQAFIAICARLEKLNKASATPISDVLKA